MQISEYNLGCQIRLTQQRKSLVEVPLSGDRYFGWSNSRMKKPQGDCVVPSATQRWLHQALCWDCVTSFSGCVTLLVSPPGSIDLLNDCLIYLTETLAPLLKWLCHSLWLCVTPARALLALRHPLWVALSLLALIYLSAIVFSALDENHAAKLPLTALNYSNLVFVRALLRQKNSISKFSLYVCSPTNPKPSFNTFPVDESTTVI